MKRFLSAVILITLGSLFYVHLEVEAVQVGYSLQKREALKVQFLDRARALKYNIASFKAPHYLEKRLSSWRIHLETPQSWETLVLSSERRAPLKDSNWMRMSADMAGVFGRFLVGTAQAEAGESS